MMWNERVDAIVIASGNRHKVEEIRTIIGQTGIQWIPGSDYGVQDIKESGDTYRKNAIIKAERYSMVAGLPALADDSGLEIAALDGLPGVRSSRLFGENKSDAEKVQALLERMKRVPEKMRTARFVCHAVLISGEKILKSCSGVTEGNILSEPAGEGGFGYDPIFFIPELGKTYAQLDALEKNNVSHRGKAMRKIRDFLLRYTDNSW
jgi:XTP/dITP diphosphohydrolase